MISKAQFKKHLEAKNSKSLAIFITVENELENLKQYVKKLGFGKASKVVKKIGKPNLALGI